MCFKRISLIIALIGLAAGLNVLPVFAEDAGTLHKMETRKDARWLCDMFMLKLTEFGARQAFQTLQPYSSSDKDSFAELVQKADSIIETVKPDYGSIVGYELVQEKNVKNIVLRYTYLLKFEKHALRWMFYFYRAEDEWLFNEFNVDNKLHELFE